MRVLLLEWNREDIHMLPTFRRSLRSPPSRRGEDGVSKILRNVGSTAHINTRLLSKNSIDIRSHNPSRLTVLFWIYNTHLTKEIYTIIQKSIPQSLKFILMCFHVLHACDWGLKNIWGLLWYVFLGNRNRMSIWNPRYLLKRKQLLHSSRTCSAMQKAN
jgi:hypothetical protein